MMASTKEGTEKGGMPEAIEGKEENPPTAPAPATFPNSVQGTISGTPTGTDTNLELNTTDGHVGKGTCGGTTAWPGGGVSGTLQYTTWTELRSQKNTLIVDVKGNNLTINFRIGNKPVALFKGTWYSSPTFRVSGSIGWDE